MMMKEKASAPTVNVRQWKTKTKLAESEKKKEEKPLMYVMRLYGLEENAGLERSM